MRVMDLGCGRAASSIFLRCEFGVQVWATDLWFSASENQRRVVDDGVFPIQCDARSLPFANEFFDAVISIDSFIHCGTEESYLNYLARFLKPEGLLAIAGAGRKHDFDENAVPQSLNGWWTPEMYCLHSADWWRRHWLRTGIVDVARADLMPDGWRYWLEWHRLTAPDNAGEIQAIEADQGENMGYVRVTARKKPGIVLQEPITTIPTQYQRQPLWRGASGS